MRSLRSRRVPLRTAAAPARSRLPSGVDDVDVPEPARHATVAHGVHLGGLSLSIIEGAAQVVALGTADHVERAPELRRAHLVRDVLQHAGDLSALDLVEELP